MIFSSRRPSELLGVVEISKNVEEELSIAHQHLLEKENILIGRARDNSQLPFWSGISEAKYAARRPNILRPGELFQELTGEPLDPELEAMLRKKEPDEKPVPNEKKVQVYTRECPGCGKSFQSTHETGDCYDCTLDRITHGGAPEEGDFNSAKIISGTLTKEEAEYLQQDLASVESDEDNSNN